MGFMTVFSFLMTIFCTNQGSEPDPSYSALLSHIFYKYITKIYLDKRGLGDIESKRL